VCEREGKRAPARRILKEMREKKKRKKEEKNGVERSLKPSACELGAIAGPVSDPVALEALV